MTNLDDYYLRFAEPYQGCLLSLRYIILDVNKEITHERKYQIPFFLYKGKKLAFLWVTHKKLMVGFVTDKSILISENGTKLKDQLEMIQVDPNADIPKEMIVARLEELIHKYDTV